VSLSFLPLLSSPKTSRGSSLTRSRHSFGGWVFLGVSDFFVIGGFRGFGDHEAWGNESVLLLLDLLLYLARLKQRSQETHAPQTALAERYIEEGLRHDEHPLIYFRDGEMGRRPALLGTRLDVAEVISTACTSSSRPSRVTGRASG